jgi:UDP-glucose 4-epimerase
LAANPDVAIGTENSQIDFQQNVQATYNLLEAIRKSQRVLDSENTTRNETQKKNRVIFASTVYGKASKQPTPEKRFLCTVQPSLHARLLIQVIATCSISIV